MTQKERSKWRLVSSELAHQKFRATRDKTGIAMYRLVDIAAEMLAEKYGVKAPRARRKPTATASA